MASDALCAEMGNLGRDSWARDLACIGSLVNDAVRGPSQPVYNVYPGAPASGEPQISNQGGEIRLLGGGTNPLLIGAAIGGTLLTGIVLVKVLS